MHLNPRFRVEPLRAEPPMVFRARIWRDGASDQAARFAAILQKMAPHTPASLQLGSTAQERAYIDSLGGSVAWEMLPELLRRCEMDNLQLAWQGDASGPALDVICELYDEHIEIAVRPPLQARVEHVLVQMRDGAA